jgi:hypothetical protein
MIILLRNVKGVIFKWFHNVICFYKKGGEVVD